MEHIELLRNSEVIRNLAMLLKSPKQEIRRLTTWAFSNLIGSEKEFIDDIFEYKNGEIVEELLWRAEHEDFQVKAFDILYFMIWKVAKECLCCFINICKKGTVEQIMNLVDSKNIIEVLVDSLKENSDEDLIGGCLDALETILWSYKDHFEDVRGILQKLSSCGGYPVLEDLQGHQSQSVYLKVSEIIEKYLDFA